MQIPVTIVPQREGDKLSELQTIHSSGIPTELLERVATGAAQLRDALRK